MFEPRRMSSCSRSTSSCRRSSDRTSGRRKSSGRRCGKTSGGWQSSGSGSRPDATHFLGAIVVQAQEPILGDLPASSIIDGQQRLTTLQLLMDATAAALEAIGEDALCGQLGRLTHNEDIYVPARRTRGSSSGTATRTATPSTR